MWLQIVAQNLDMLHTLQQLCYINMTLLLCSAARLFSYYTSIREQDLYIPQAADADRKHRIPVTHGQSALCRQHGYRACQER